MTNPDIYKELKEEHKIYCEVEKMLNIVEPETFENWLKDIFDGVFTPVSNSAFNHNLVSGGK